VGQQVSEQTFHEIAAARDRFEPPIGFDVESLEVVPGRNAIVLTVGGSSESAPFTCGGRAFERVENTTRKMSQPRYEALLLERAHSRRRWENQEADEITDQGAQARPRQRSTSIILLALSFFGSSSSERW